MIDQRNINSPIHQRLAARDSVALSKGYHSPQLNVRVRLNTNESPLPPPQGWFEGFLAAQDQISWHRYPDREAKELRAAIAKHEGVEPTQVFAANGSNEVLQCLMLAFGGPGRSALVFEPTYALHSHIARLTATEVIAVQRVQDFGIDLGYASTMLVEHRPAVTFLCSPNNPTGTVDAPELIQALLDIVADLPGLLLMDEAYGQFAPYSAISLIEEARPLAVARTYSKTWSMAAARLGYLIAPAWVICELEKVALPYHLDSVKQIAGRLALQYQVEMAERVGELVAERERIAAELAKLAVQQWPSGANFILFRPNNGDGQGVWNGLLERSVLVRNCASWPYLAGCLRVTVGTPVENDVFLSALSEVLQ
ncbi:MAG: histidinol-phosphate transaminase [Acidimicrobiia bacterium]|nr:histidinol-phosphate transaminase [Acidimicrobiia bacterium]MYC57187.1 histidinol-phosphate transaminase [Acidimicrobiia bacterium]MYG93886.1 histidinol-phosphate transaminase [Acidimicrobiia bacterium]MYI29889.1 histidinol-phosphate transaminase [Acidimicrobiia bacterium]